MKETALTDRKRFTVPLLAALLLAAAGLASARDRPVQLELDARDAPRKIFHAKMTIPVKEGRLTLLYPKWLPGEHGPTGPITDLAGLTFTAGGRPLPWRRDPVEMYAFEIDVPPGPGTVEVALDYLSPAETGGFSSGSSATANLTLLSWNQVLLYPKGMPSDEIDYEATLRLPAGWKYATALTTRSESGGAVHFEPVSLTTLVDSPVLTGSHFRVVTLEAAPIAHRIDIASDSEATLEMSPEDLTHYKNLVAETGALFSARHYRHYDFLLTLSDHVAHFGLEHHESSDDRVPERCLVDEDKRKTDLAGLLPHEMTHSWNGKYRRPADLAPGRFDVPMQGNLLWVYEGLTEYLGQVLTARSGLLTAEQYRQSLALTAASMEATKGRAWRPLADTAVAAQVLYDARADWALWRRGVDFYPESELLWLEADAKIRKETGGQKSLNDFCRLFFGGASGPPKVLPYTFEDVVGALNQIAPSDWKSFWRTRLDSTSPRAPLAGIEAAGWRVVYRDTPTDMERAAEEAHETIDARFSLGFSVGKEGGIPDVVPDSPAAKAGVGPGMKITAVNGKRFSKEVFRDALKASKTHPVELLLENGDDFATYRIDYSGGERYPDLERDSSKPDVLSQIIRPLAQSAAAR
jgi:predicted metalloprotease with PDZ domain